MKTLSKLLANVEVLKINGDVSTEVHAVNFFSNISAPHSIFISAKNIEHDGFDSITEAVKNGAIVVVHESELKEDEEIEGIVYVKVKNGARSLGIIANNFFDNPSESFKLVGVTGTNGKTTVATSLYKLFRILGYKVALISTVENKINDEVFVTIHTTPTPVNLASILSKAKEADVEYVFMECSSHGIEEERIAGLRFAGGIFTNFTQDHLNFHGTMENYARAKKKFFDNLPSGAFALSNADDLKGEYMLQDSQAKKYFYGIDKKANFLATEVNTSFQGMDFRINDKIVHSKLVGKFNVYNLLSVYGAAYLLGISADTIISILQQIDPPNGRMEIFKSASGVCGIVDFAHTPDALEKVINTLIDIKSKDSKIITVVGCGGGGDKSKRPQMGEIVVRLSDYSIFTSDNPRMEDPDDIIQQIVTGVPSDASKFECITERKVAIAKAVSIANADDIVLVAGKGHENYQDIGGEKIHYSDQEELRKMLGLDVV